MNDNGNNEIVYESTGWDSLNEIQRSGAGLPWLDFKQGQGDTATLRLLEIKGTRSKSYKGGEPYQVLEMRVEVHSRNNVDCTPEEHLTNPKAAWCLGIKGAINSIAKKNGWNGNPSELGRYASFVPNYMMRWTRNDDRDTRMGKIDVDILGEVGETPFDSPEDALISKIQSAKTIAEMDEAFKNTKEWEGLPPDVKDTIRGLYAKRKEEIGQDIPW